MEWTKKSESRQTDDSGAQTTFGANSFFVCRLISNRTKQAAHVQLVLLKASKFDVDLALWVQLR